MHCEVYLYKHVLWQKDEGLFITQKNQQVKKCSFLDTY